MRTTTFKQTELGPIPSDWEVKRIDQCGDVITGSTPPRENPELWNGYFNWVSAKDFKGKYIVSSDEKVSEKGKRYCRPLPKDSVLVTCIASIGLNAIAKQPCATNQQINAIISKNCDFEYLYYQCCFSVERLRQIAGQTAVPIVGKSQFEEFLIALPTNIDEQHRIAAALSDVDELIGALGKLVEKKRAIKTGAMQRLLTGQTRLPGFGGKWVEKRLGDCGYCFNGITGKSASDFGHGKSHYITFLNVLSNVVIDTSIFETVNIGPRESQNEVRQGDLFFNTSSETPEEVGLCAVLERDVKSVYLNSFCFGFRLTDEKVSGKYLAYWFRSEGGRILMMSLAQGSTRYNLSKNAFCDASVPLPPLPEQRAIAAVLSDMDAEIAALEAEKRKAEAIKQGMMQELLTGKTRLCEGNGGGR